MATGSEMMMQSALNMVLKVLGITPESAKNSVAEIQQIIAEYAGRQARIEQKLDMLLLAHNIHPEHDDGKAVAGNRGIEGPRGEAGKSAGGQ